MISHIAPELVDKTAVSEARDGGLVDLAESDAVVHGARTYYDAIDNSANGAFGDPTDATAEKGERLFEAATEQLVHLLEWLEAREPEALRPEPRVE